MSLCGLLRFEILRWFAKVNQESMKETEEPESINVQMFLMFVEFSKM